MPTIKILGKSCIQTSSGSLHEGDLRILGKEDLVWILLYADALHLCWMMLTTRRKAFFCNPSPSFLKVGLADQGWEVRVAVYVPQPGAEPFPVPAISVDNKSEHVAKGKCLGGIVSQMVNKTWN